MYTASSIFFKTLCDVGITHAFVNWGSDHPALLADLDRQRNSYGSAGQTKPTIVTCPNEMVALSAAQGYAQVTGKPALVIVHVDVGTQALAGAIHNVDRNRAPVIIYAGASPFSTEGEHKGGRNEWIMWLQDIPDQAAIVRQYMRYTCQLNSALTIPPVIRRAVQIATSEPRGPVYLWARREVMEQEIDPLLFKEVTAAISHQAWPAIEPTALSLTAASRIAAALLTAQYPLIITSYLGRNPHAVSPLLALSTLLAIPILPVCPSVVSVPSSHPFGLAPTFLTQQPNSNFDDPLESPHAFQNLNHLGKADVVIVVDADLAWIPGNDQRPGYGARIFVLDSGDPLKTTVQMGWWRGEAEMICRADAEVALVQVLDAVRDLDRDGMIAEGEDVKRRGRRLRSAWDHRRRDMDAVELDFFGAEVLEHEPLDAELDRANNAVVYTVPNIIRALREAIHDLTPSHGERILVLNESISNFQIVWEHMRPEMPGSMLSSGGSSLGWALGAAVGASLGGAVVESPALPGITPEPKHDLVVAIVGDGSFIFGVPSAAYWMARRYNTPFVTIVLNNGGWKSPKLSMLSVHPIGHNSQLLAIVPGDDLSVGFGPVCPDYSQIAVAASAGWAWGTRIGGNNPDNHAIGNGSIIQHENDVIDGVAAGVQDSSTGSAKVLPRDGGKALLEATIAKAIRTVLEEKRAAVVDCVLETV